MTFFSVPSDRVLAFFDTEFGGLKKNTDLISIGIVTQDGDEFYAELTDYNPEGLEEWQVKNVLPLLYYNTDGQHQGKASVAVSTKESPHHYCGDSKHVRSNLNDWLRMQAYGGKKIVLVSDCDSYDHVLIADLLAPNGQYQEPKYPMDIIDGYAPIDIATMYFGLHGKMDFGREKLAGMENSKEKHNALYDAKIIKGCYNEIIRQYNAR